jgi:hypothetical protein
LPPHERALRTAIRKVHAAIDQKLAAEIIAVYGPARMDQVLEFRKKCDNE